ncbi:MAG: hydroxymethylbilane synthase [Acidimicrobiia bacterium]
MIRIATRGSALARWQAERVGTLLAAPFELVIVETTGDQRADIPIAQMGGQGMFVKEVQAAVLAGQADCAVHSAKDLPSLTAPGLTLAAVPERSDPHDVLVGATLHGLRAGALVATGSVRRRAQLANLRPDLVFAELRGNIETRLRKAEQFDAIVMAAAALHRTDRADAITDLLPVTAMVPQTGQGAIAVECRRDDATTLTHLAAIDSPDDHCCVRIERAFLAAIAQRATESGSASGCDLPTGAYAQLHGDGAQVHTMLATPDGRVVVRRTHESATVAVPESIGADAADALLEETGASVVFDEVIA